MACILPVILRACIPVLSKRGNVVDDIPWTVNIAVSEYIAIIPFSDQTGLPSAFLHSHHTIL